MNQTAPTIRQPDHSDDATRQAAREKSRDRAPQTEFSRPLFPSQVLGACGPRGGRRCIRRAAVSGGGGETVRVFGRPEELAERLAANGYDIPASEIEAGMELHLPCLVKVAQGNNGYKIIEEFLPDAAQ